MKKLALTNLGQKDNIFTASNVPTAKEFGVGELWIDGVQYWSDGIDLSLMVDNHYISNKSLVLLDGVTGKITLPKTYTLATDGDYVEWLGRLDEYAGGAGGAALGLIGLDDGATGGWVGYSSSTGKIAVRETGQAYKDVTAFSGNEQYKFHRIRVTQTSSILWTVSVDSVDQGTIVRASNLSMNNVGQGYVTEHCQATLVELMIVTSVTGNLTISNFSQDISDKKLTNSGTTFAEMSYSDTSIIALRSKEITDISNREAIFIYVPQESSTKYIKYDYTHSVNAGLFADVWRIRSAYIVESVEFPFVWGDERIITTTGEWENAVKISGESDFFGGDSHGNDESFSNTVLIDDNYIDLDNLNLYAGNSLNMKQSSLCYKGTKTTNVAQSDRVWKFKPNGVDISNKLTWITNESLLNSYLAMAPVLRSDGTGKLTEFGLWGENPTPVDISSEGFTIVENSESEISCYSDTSGLFVSINVISGWGNANANTWISNVAAYNKIYCDFTDTYFVTAGETFDAKSEITFKLTN